VVGVIFDCGAELPGKAADDFFVFWDNAYAVHELGTTTVSLANLMEECRARGTQDRVVIFGSTSKVTFAGAGLAFMGASVDTLNAFRRHLSVSTIGPGKVNQLRHLRFLPDMGAVRDLMARHAALLGPKFQCVQQRLREGLEGRGMGVWTDPAGGYFVSFDALPGLAAGIIDRAAPAGVKLTPAGAAFPFGRWKAAGVVAAVRVNPLNDGGLDDLEAVMRGAPDAILLPKANDAEQIRALAAELGVG
jgi:DNA-binding transcriptional MocR family regulator